MFLVQTSSKCSYLYKGQDRRIWYFLQCPATILRILSRAFAAPISMYIDEDSDQNLYVSMGVKGVFCTYAM